MGFFRRLGWDSIVISSSVTTFSLLTLKDKLLDGNSSLPRLHFPIASHTFLIGFLPHHSPEIQVSTKVANDITSEYS